MFSFLKPKPNNAQSVGASVRNTVGPLVTIPSSFESITILKTKVGEALDYLISLDVDKDTTNPQLSHALKSRQEITKTALDEYKTGDEQSKVYLLDIIKDFITENVSEANLVTLLQLNESRRYRDTPLNIQFEIMLHKYRKTHGKDALEHWVVKNKFNSSQKATDGLRTTDIAYYISNQDIEEAFQKELKNYNLTKYDHIEVLAILVYQELLGNGIVDTILDMNIEGLNLGTSGATMSTLISTNAKDYRATRSVWVTLGGRTLHFRFLEFKTQQDIMKIAENLLSTSTNYNQARDTGYAFNTLKDNSTVTVLSPAASECWEVFVKKVVILTAPPEFLIDKEYVTNANVTLLLLEYLVRGRVSICITGARRTGKTTLLASMIRYIDPRLPIKVIEENIELHLRDIYPTRNVISLKAHNALTRESTERILKGTPEGVRVYGTVSDDALAADMLKAGETEALLTLFTHYAASTEDLVTSLRDALITVKGYSKGVAETKVTNVVNINIHLDKTTKGEFYISRISEIAPIADFGPIPEIDDSNYLRSQTLLLQEDLRRKYITKQYEVRDILKFDLSDYTYKAVGRMSPTLEMKIKDNIQYSEDTRLAFDKFIYHNWGIRKDIELAKIVEEDHVAKAILQAKADGKINLSSDTRIEEVQLNQDAIDKLIAATKEEVKLEKREAEEEAMKANIQDDDSIMEDIIRFDGEFKV